MPAVTRDKAILTLLYFANLATSYLLMLAVMTYNVGFFLAVSGGMALGYYVFFDSTAAAGVRALPKVWMG